MVAQFPAHVATLLIHKEVDSKPGIRLAQYVLLVAQEACVSDT